VHADRYFGLYRGKNGHTANTREPTLFTQSGHKKEDRRGDLFEKRRLLMQQWATYCTMAPEGAAKVIPMRG
jgi:hypothetical protein